MMHEVRLELLHSIASSPQLQSRNFLLSILNDRLRSIRHDTHRPFLHLRRVFDHLDRGLPQVPRQTLSGAEEYLETEKSGAGA